MESYLAPYEEEIKFIDHLQSDMLAVINKDQSPFPQPVDKLAMSRDIFSCHNLGVATGI